MFLSFGWENPPKVPDLCVPDASGRCWAAASSSSTAARPRPHAGRSPRRWSPEGGSAAAGSPARWRCRRRSMWRWLLGLLVELSPGREQIGAETSPTESKTEKWITGNYVSRLKVIAWEIALKVISGILVGTYSHAVKHLRAVVDRGDLLGWQDRTDVLDGEPLHGGAHSLLLAVPPQPNHGGQVLHRAVVHAARQVGELPLKPLPFCFWGEKKEAAQLDEEMRFL